MVATLLFGLSEDSRVKRKVSNNKLSFNQMLLCSIYDSLQFLCWTKTKDAQKNKNRPKSILEKMLGEDKKNKDELQSFATIEEYETYMSRFTRG